MVADDPASRGPLWLGDDSALAAAKPIGAICIDCSTLTVPWVQELAAAAAARKTPLPRRPRHWHQTPRRQRRAAAFLVGGDPVTLEKVRTILALMSKEITSTSAPPPPAPLSNSPTTSSAASRPPPLAHAYALLQSAVSLDLQKAVPLLLNSGPRQPPDQNPRRPRHANHDSHPNFQLHLLRKRPRLRRPTRHRRRLLPRYRPRRHPTIRRRHRRRPRRTRHVRHHPILPAIYHARQPIDFIFRHGYP